MTDHDCTVVFTAYTPAEARTVELLGAILDQLAANHAVLRQIVEELRLAKVAR